jgi:hypothetical protein
MTAECVNQLAVLVSSPLDSKFLRYRLAEAELAAGFNEQHRAAHSTTRQNKKLRREVQNAMQALREIPPFEREREIEAGRYSYFSPEERELLRNPN